MSDQKLLAALLIYAAVGLPASVIVGWWLRHIRRTTTRPWE